eukprot:EG_transcript_19335
MAAVDQPTRRWGTLHCPASSSSPPAGCRGCVGGVACPSAALDREVFLAAVIAAEGPPHSLCHSSAVDNPVSAYCLVGVQGRCGRSLRTPALRDAVASVYAQILSHLPTVSTIL